MTGYHYKMLKEAEFNTTKAMLNAGIPVGLVVKVSKRSWFTIANIQKATSFENYKQRLQTYYNFRKSKKTEQAVTEKPIASNPSRVVALLDFIVLGQGEIKQDLDRIKRRLAIVE